MLKNISRELMAEYAKVAYLSYKVGLTQDQISKKMNMSRQRVNRILKDSLELGIVQIHINNFGADEQLEVDLEQKYGLVSCVVVDSYDRANIHKDLGEGAAEYLSKVLKDGDTVGFSRGRSISALVDSMPKLSNRGIVVTQLLGSENNRQSNKESDNIVYRFSEKVNGFSKLLYAPVIVKNRELRDSMLNDPYYADAYEILKKCDVAVFGIGNAESQSRHMSLLYNDKFMEDDTWKKGIAGEVCSHYFDESGKKVIVPFEDRIIAIQLDDFFKIPLRIGVAGGQEKAEAIKAALTGKYVNVLVVDKETAKFLL